MLIFRVLQPLTANVSVLKSETVITVIILDRAFTLKLNGEISLSKYNLNIKCH